MHGAVEALAEEDDGKRERQKWKSVDVSQAEITREEVTHVRAEDARETKRGPVSRAEHGQVFSFHEGRPLSNAMFDY
jgi:hypothetical protein